MWEHSGTCSCGKRVYLFSECKRCLKESHADRHVDQVKRLEDNVEEDGGGEADEYMFDYPKATQDNPDSLAGNASTDTVPQIAAVVQEAQGPGDTSGVAESIRKRNPSRTFLNTRRIVQDRCHWRVEAW